MWMHNSVEMTENDSVEAERFQTKTYFQMYPV